MAWAAKAANELQVFRGSKPRLDVFAQSLSDSNCCDDGTAIAHDKLARRVRFDNGLSHLNPSGGTEIYRVPDGDGMTSTRQSIIDHINANGVGARIALIAIPTYAFLTGVGVHISEEETGLTFNLVTRNGLVLPVDAGEGAVIQVAVTGDSCAPTRTQTVGSLAGFGALGGASQIDIFARYGQGNFALESDEIVLEVASMPAGGAVTGAFDLSVSASYDMIHRAEV